MTCNYFEYRRMTEDLFYGVPLTDSHLNDATEKLRQYLINGRAEYIGNKLGIGIRTISNGSQIIRHRFIFISGDNKGRELSIHEIEGIGYFLKYGLYDL